VVEEGVLQGDERAHPLRVQVGKVVGRHHPEVQTADHRLVDPELVQQADEVRRDGRHVVRRDVRRRAGAAEPTQVGCDHPEARLRELTDLVPPAVPKMREPVQQQH
jgi:hypothetical protein